jgi:hypothetical protein
MPSDASTVSPNCGRLEVDLSIPVALGGDDGPGTNPEELFAVGFAACFQSAAARRRPRPQPRHKRLADHFQGRHRSTRRRWLRTRSLARPARSHHLARRRTRAYDQGRRALPVLERPAGTSPSCSPSTASLPAEHAKHRGLGTARQTGRGSSSRLVAATPSADRTRPERASDDDPFAVREGVNGERDRQFSGADVVSAANRGPRCGGKDGKVVEKRGGNGAQTVRSFQAPKPPQQAESLCHRLPPVASKVAW